jgi:quercetin dioxygenase-like cupin family protein
VLKSSGHLRFKLTSPVPHCHENFDEAIYGLSGIMTFIVEGKAIDIAPGETCFIPRGAVDGFDNLKQEDAKALAVIMPALPGPIGAAIRTAFFNC